MFGPEEQLKAFKTEDTLKIVNIRPDGSQVHAVNTCTDPVAPLYHCTTWFV